MAWDVFMKLKINGSDVSGMSDRHVDGIDINSFEWGLDHEGGDGEFLGKMIPQDLVVSRFQDAVSPVFTAAMNMGFNVDEITFTSAGEGTNLDWEFVFTNCRLKQQVWRGDGGDTIEEELIFRYSELVVDAWAFDDAGVEKGTNSADWANVGA